MRLIFLFLLAVGPFPNSEAPKPARPARLGCAASAAPDSLAVYLQARLTSPALSRPAPQARELRTFYDRRHYAPAWFGSPRAHACALATANLLEQAQDYGLSPRHYRAAAVRALLDSLNQPPPASGRIAQQGRLELLLTQGALTFARHLRRGRLHAATPSPLEKDGQPFEPARWVARALNAPDFAAALLRCQPQHREYQQLQQALVRWRRRPAGHNPARQQWQQQQLVLNLERWRWNAIPEAEYVLANLPAFSLTVVRRGRARQAHRLIIGTPATPTPTFSSHFASFTLAPEWQVPRSIATQQILPYLQDNARQGSHQDFLANNNYRLYDARGQLIDPRTVNWLAVTAQNFAYTIRQCPGCGNLLGTIIFNFPNPYGLYLNDGPDALDFGRPYRALEQGCMRVDAPLQLAAFLLGPAESQRAGLPAEGTCEPRPRPRTFYLPRAVPLHVRYATCAVVAGKLRFYADVYGQDAVLRRQLFGR